MKLTMTKISVPVLMMMMFHSGYGISDWAANASLLFAQGRPVDAIRYVHQVQPDAIRVTDPSQVSPEIQAIIDGTEDRINGWWDSIKAKVADFVPRRADADFQDKVIGDFNQLLTGDIDPAAVSSVLSAEIVSSFYTNVGFLDHDAAVANQINDVMNKITANNSVWRTSAVPAEGTDEYWDLVGANSGSTGDHTIWKFIHGVDGYDVHTGPVALEALLDHDYLRSLRVTEYFNWETLTNAVKAVSEDERVSTVYNALVNRANEVRGEYIPTIAESVVPWGPEEAKKTGDDAAWKSIAAEWIGGLWNDSQTDAQLKEALYSSSALTLATGLDPDPEAPGDHYGYEDSDELTYYLNLFGNRSIGGNQEAPDEKEVFLQSILTKIEADVKAEGADVGDPGTAVRALWVDMNPDTALGIVQQAVYSVFGDKYAELLHHSNPISDPAGLFNAITAGGIGEFEGVRTAAVEDFDGDAVSQIAEWLNDIKNATPAQ